MKMPTRSGELELTADYADSADGKANAMSLVVRSSSIGGLIETRPIRAIRIIRGSKSVSLWLLFFVLGVLTVDVSLGATKPDVVVLLCDDFNPFYTGFAGDPDVRTPNLDALAKESAVFSRCYTTSPVCMPSRTSLVTGLYPHNTGCWGNANDLFVSPRLTSLFSDFKQAGYVTAMIGKTHWYAGSDFKAQFASKKEFFTGIGVDEFHEVPTTFGSRNGSGAYQDFLKRIGKFKAQSKDLTDRLRNDQYVARPSLLQPEETCDWMMNDLVVDYLKRAARDKPFMLLVGFSNPHSPFDPSGRYATMYDANKLALRKNVTPFKKYGTDYSLAELRRARAAYLGKISFLDDLLGRVIAALKQRGNWANTILVFTADHGLAVGEHGNIAKGQFWEEVARVPMVVRIPGLTDGGIETDALAQLNDLYPTLLAAVGGKVSEHVRARSLLPVLRDPGVTVRDAVFGEISGRTALNYMVRDGRFKWFEVDGKESLYDLAADPYEQVNLIDSAAHRSVVAGLRERLRRFLMTEQLNHSAGYVPLANRVKNAKARR